MEGKTIQLEEMKFPPLSVMFKDENGNLVGHLFIENKELKFTGKTDESASIFFEELTKIYNSNQKDLESLIK